MTRIYFNPNNKNTAYLDTVTKTITHATGAAKTYTNNQKAAQDIRAHGYKLIAIKNN